MKTWLTALFCTVRAILYPGSKIVVCSFTRKQGNEVLLKIQDDFMKKSPLLCLEIEKCNIGANDAVIYFKNGSWIRVATASDSGRGIRGNILIVDESRMVDQHIIKTVLQPFLIAPRQPNYLNKKQYTHLKERNKEIYMSSAYLQESYMYLQAQSYTANSLDDTKRYFICALPYQISVKEGLLLMADVEDKMSDATFSDITWMMEMGALFYGCGDENLFKYSELDERRVLHEPLYPLELYRERNIKIPSPEKNEVRILSVDIALMASKKHKNDASAFIINRALKTSDTTYMSNIAMIDTKEGLVTNDLGLLIMRYFYQYQCDYIAIDGSGVGQPLVDYLLESHFDPDYGVTYQALNCCNNDAIASRCKVKNAPKVIYVYKPNLKDNNDMYLALRSAFQNKKINLLISDNKAEIILKSNIKGFNKLSATTQADYKLPYAQTSLLIEELTKLEHEANGAYIRVKEKSGMRKDRVSSLLYNYDVVTQLERKLKPRTKSTESLISMLPIRKGVRRGYH